MAGPVDPWAVGSAYEPYIGRWSRLVAADARRLPAGDARFDAVVSGLVLNFVPDPALAVREMARVTRPGGRVAAYVWDYAGGMELIRRFWDAAVALDPDAAGLDEGRRFGLCRPEPLGRLPAASDGSIALVARAWAVAATPAG